MGANFRAKIAGSFFNCLERLVLPLLYRPKGKELTLIDDISYTEERRSKCEFIYKNNVRKKLPVIIFLHGGGWVSGYKKVRRFYCYEYAERGFFVVNVDYEYAPYKKHPYQVQQVLDLLSMLVERKDELNIDMERVVLAGDSAGAYLAAITAAIVCCDGYDKAGVKCKREGEFNVRAVLSICGAFDASELIENPKLGMTTFLSAFTGVKVKYLSEVLSKGSVFDLSAFLTVDYPPIFLIKASKDALKVESDRLEKQLKTMGCKCSSYLATGLLSHHCFPLLCRTSSGRECLSEAMEYIKKQLV